MTRTMKQFPILIALLLTSLGASAVTTNVPISSLPVRAMVANHDAFAIYYWTGTNYIVYQMSGASLLSVMTNVAISQASIATNNIKLRGVTASGASVATTNSGVVNIFTPNGGSTNSINSTNGFGYGTTIFQTVIASNYYGPNINLTNGIGQTISNQINQAVSSMSTNIVITNAAVLVAQDAAQSVVNQKLYQDVSLTIRGYGERAFDAMKVTFNDGTIGHRPGLGYGNVYLRDFLMTREGLPERVTLTESWNILNTFSNTFYQAGWFVDSVDAAKLPNATGLIAWNAFTNNGSTIINPALDCAFDFTHAMFMDYRQRGNPLSFTNHWLVASNGMNFIGWSNSTLTAIPSVRITNDLVYLDKVALLNSPTFKWFGEFGFNDGIPKAGYSLWLSLLRFRALNESSEMAAAAGQQTTASNLAYQARSCSTNLITYLWTSTNWFLSCSITNDVADAIGSAFAVWIGAVDKPHALLIASNCVATSPGGVAFATNPSLTNGAPYFPGAGQPWKYSPISAPGTSQNQTAWPGFAGMWNYCCALWDGGVAAQNWYTLAATYATWNNAPIEYLAKPGSGNGTSFYMQGAQALSFFDHVATDFQFKNFATNGTSTGGFLGNSNQFLTTGGVTSVKSGASFTNTPLYGSSTVLGTLVLSGLSEDFVHTKPLFVSPAGDIVGWSQNGNIWTNLQYGGLSPAAQQIITNIAFSFASGGTNLDLGNSTNLPYSGLSLTAQTDITNVTLSLLNGSNQLASFSFYTNATESVYNVKAFGAKGNGVTLNNGTIAAGSSIYTCTNAAFTSSDVGKVISIYMAGTNYTVDGFSYGLNLTATIQSTNSPTSVVLNRAALRGMTNRAAVYGSDDTVAIQTAMNVVSTNGGGTIYFPRGIYIINGALQDPGTNTLHHNAQLYFPEIAKTGHELPTVTFAGEQAGFSRGLDSISPYDITSYGSTLWSTFERSPDPQNPARVIDCQNFNTYAARGGCLGDDIVSLNSLKVNVHDMNWRCGRDADMWCLNLQGTEGCKVEGVAVTTGFDHTNPEGVTTYTGTNGVGILSSGSFNENMVRVDNVMVRGFYTALKSEENMRCPYIFIGDAFYGIDLGVAATAQVFDYVNCQESFCVFRAHNCHAEVRAPNVSTYNYTFFTNSCKILVDAGPVIAGRIHYTRYGVYPALAYTNTLLGGLTISYSLDTGQQQTYYQTPLIVTNSIQTTDLQISSPTAGAKLHMGTNWANPTANYLQAYANGSVLFSLFDQLHSVEPFKVNLDDTMSLGVSGKSVTASGDWVFSGTPTANGINLTNGSPALATNSATATDGQVLVKRGNNLSLEAPSGGSGFATNAFNVLLTNNVAGYSNKTVLNLIAGSNFQITSVSNHGDVVDVTLGLPTTVGFTAVNVGTLGVTNPIPPEALAATNGVTDGMALTKDHATNKWASISGGGGVSGIGSTLSNTTLYGTTTVVSSNNPILELFITPGGLGNMVEATNASGQVSWALDANGHEKAHSAVVDGLFAGDGGGLTNFQFVSQQVLTGYTGVSSGVPQVVTNWVGIVNGDFTVGALDNGTVTNLTAGFYTLSATVNASVDSSNWSIWWETNLVLAGVSVTNNASVVAGAAVNETETLGEQTFWLPANTRISLKFWGDTGTAPTLNRATRQIDKR